MVTKLHYNIFQTSMGWISIMVSEKGVVAATLLQPSAEEARRALGANAEKANISSEKLADLVERFKAYFNGEAITFPDELDLSGATPFRCSVWRQTRLIPRGETRSYRWVAEQIGKPRAARAVGLALGANPLLIIVPCHRVIASDGGLGGFGGGLEMKRRLLEMEAKH